MRNLKAFSVLLFATAVALTTMSCSAPQAEKEGAAPRAEKEARPEELLSANQGNYWWIDGVYRFQAIRDDSGLRMYGTNLHEGGLGFALKATNGSKKWTVEPNAQGYCPDGYASLEYKKLDKDGKPYLIVRDQADNLVTVLRGGARSRKGGCPRDLFMAQRDLCR